MFRGSFGLIDWLIMEVHRWRPPTFTTTMAAARTADPTGHPKTVIPEANKLIAVASVITVSPPTAIVITALRRRKPNLSQCMLKEYVC